MTVKRGLTFTERDSVATDGIHFIECRFERANLVYSGGDHPRFERCAFSNASWTFAGAALRTVELLRAVKSSPGGDAFLADLLAPAPPEPRSGVRSF
jgi:hypothetical protein